MKGSTWVRSAHYAVVGLLLAALVAACGSEGEGTSAKSGEGLSGTVKVGVPIDLSGVASLVGKQSRQGMELARDELNEGGTLGKAKLELLFRDHKTDKNQAISLTRSLIRKDKVAAIAGLNVSEIAAVVAPLGESLKTPIVTDTVVDPGFAKANDYTFLGVEPYSNQIEPFVNKYAREQGWDSVVVFQNVDVPAQAVLAPTWKKALEGIGTKVTIETYETGTPDFSAQITSIRAKKPDAIVVLDVPQTSGTIAKQAGDLGLDAVVTGNAALLDANFAKIGGRKAVGAVFPSPWAPSIDNKANQTFVSGYKSKYGETPGIFAFDGYTAVKLVGNAIARAGSSDPEAVRKALASTKDYESPAGPLTYDPDGIVDVPGVIVKIEGPGEYKTVGELE